MKGIWTKLFVLCWLTWGHPVDAKPEKVENLLGSKHRQVHAYLDAADLKAAFSKTRFESKVSKKAKKLLSYHVSSDPKNRTRIYLDKHVVRTKSESVLIAIDSASVVRGLWVVQFQEPREYQAPQAWLDLFLGKAIDGQKPIKNSYPHISGATMTSDALKDSVRRVVLLDRYLRDVKEKAKASTSETPLKKTEKKEDKKK